MKMTKEEFFEKGKGFYGEDNLNWMFKCPHCKREQSFNSVIQQMKDGSPSKRFGLLKKGDPMGIESSCFSPSCNWTANGLFSSDILVILDKSKPHDANRKENCYYVFPFGKEKVGD